MAPYRRIFWALVAPLGVAVFYTVESLSERFAKAPSAKTTANLVLAELAPYCVPEPKEQLAYVLSVIIPIGIAFFGTVLLKSLGVFRRSETPNLGIALLAFVAQLAVFGFATRAVVHQATEAFWYRFFRPESLIFAAIALGVGFAYARPFSRLSSPTSRAVLHRITRIQWLPWILAITWVAVFAMTAIYRDRELPYTTNTVKFHLAYTMGEFAAPLNGRVPLVNFFSQYANILGLMAVPFFKLIGFDILKYTVFMFCCTLSAFCLLFASLRRLCNSGWTALAMFAPIVAVGFYSEEANANGFLSHTFNYFAVGPIRYLGMCIMAWFAVWYSGKPSVVRLSTSAFVGTLVAFNNLDFGIPAALGVFACVLLFPPVCAGTNLVGRIIGSAFLFVCVSTATLGLYCLVIRMATGVWPMLGQLTVYQSTFALLGFFMMPMPEVGLHWVIYLTFLSAVVIPIYETFSTDHDTIADNRRTANCSLAYSGIAGFGAYTYFVGRSHQWVLEATFLIWAFVLAQLVLRNLQNWREGTAKSSRRSGAELLPLPAVASLGVFFLLVTMMYEAPNPKKQVFRLTAKFATEEPADAKLVELVGKYVRRREKTVIVYRDAHWLALRAGVTNVYPFAHVGSLILKDQLNSVMATLTRLDPKHKYVFGSPVPELAARLEQDGFTKIDGVGDFAVWSKGVN